MNTCGSCLHWRLEGPLAAHGFGTCAVRPELDKRVAVSTPEQSTCRIGRFEAKKQGEADAAPAAIKNLDHGKDYATP